MKCEEYQSLLADDQTPELDAHLRDCPECRDLAAEIDTNLQILASMRDEVLPVRVKTASPPRWVWAAAAAIVLVSGLSLVRWRAPIPPPMPPPAPVVSLVINQSDPPLPPQRPAMVAPRKPPRTVSIPEEPLLVQFLTPDPDIVIYWLIEPKEDSQKGLL